MKLYKGFYGVILQMILGPIIIYLCFINVLDVFNSVILIMLLFFVAQYIIYYFYSKNLLNIIDDFFKLVKNIREEYK